MDRRCGEFLRRASSFGRARSLDQDGFVHSYNPRWDRIRPNPRGSPSTDGRQQSNPDHTPHLRYVPTSSSTSDEPASSSTQLFDMSLRLRGLNAPVEGPRRIHSSLFRNQVQVQVPRSGRTKDAQALAVPASFPVNRCYVPSISLSFASYPAFAAHPQHPTSE